MKTYRFVYTLDKLEYMEYMKSLVSSIKENRIKKIWLMISIPALLLFTVIYFSEMDLLYKLLLMMLAILWVLFIWKKLWMKYLNKKVNDNFLKNIGFKESKEIKIIFDENAVNVNNTTFEYLNIKKMRMLENVLILFYQEKQALILPKRVIGDEEDVRTFIKFIYLNTQLS